MDKIKKEVTDAIKENQVEELAILIHAAVFNSEISTKEEVQKLLNECLYDAARFAHFEIVKELVKNGADVNYKDSLKQSVLHRTVMLAKSDETDNILEFLILNGANINDRCMNGQSDFMFLMGSKHLTYHHLVRLIDSVSEINETDLRTGGSYLHLVPSRPDDENKILMMRKLLEKGLDINGKDNNDDTPLHLMATIADLASMKFLVTNGADINAQSRLGETVLHDLASSNEFNGFQETLTFLMEIGMDINETDFSGKTVLHHALLSKDTEVKAVEELIRRAAKINVKDANGRNEVYIAVEEVSVSYNPSDLDRRAAVIKFLADAGVDINEGDMYGITPLHLATTKCDLEILVTLIDAGANIMKKSNSGATALHWSCKIYNVAHVMIHSYLNEHQDLNVVDNYGSTALHWAIWFRQGSVSQSLLQIGCDYGIHDKCGNTPADLAKKVYFEEFLDLLENEKFKDMEYLELQERYTECSDSDCFRACPLLRYIRKEGGKLDVEPYIKHLDCHKTSLVKCIDSSLRTEHMGLFYDLKENILIQSIVEQLMVLLNERVRERTPLFHCELRLAGSVFEGTKVGLPDEFDYLWMLTEFADAFSPVESSSFPESFVKLKLKGDADGSRFRRYLTTENFLDSRLLIRDFYHAVNEELISILGSEGFGQFSNLVCIKHLNEISCSNSSLTLQYYGEVAKVFSISIDVVATIWFQDWMPQNYKVLHSKPEQHSSVFYVIIKTPDRLHVENFTLFFRVSYAYLEQCIMRNVPKVIKKAYIILKILVESGYLPIVVDHDDDRNIKKYVTSYHLKTCFLHELELWKADVENTNETITEFKEKQRLALLWAKRVVNRYEISIKEKFLAIFFEPRKNLLGLAGFQNVAIENAICIGMVNLLQYIINIMEQDGIHSIKLSTFDAD